MGTGLFIHQADSLSIQRIILWTLWTQEFTSRSAIPQPQKWNLKTNQPLHPFVVQHIFLHSRKFHHNRKTTQVRITSCSTMVEKLCYSISTISNRDIRYVLAFLPLYRLIFVFFIVVFFACFFFFGCFVFVSSVIISVWPINALGIWLSSSLIACLCHYRVISWNGLSFRDAWQPCFSFKNDLTTLILWHLHSHCGCTLSVLQGVWETQMLHIIQASTLIVPWKLPLWLGWTENHCNIKT